METVEVVVVGAGAMGAAAAWTLGRDGREAIVVERFEAGHDRGSSHGATRIFRFAYDDPFTVAAAQKALPLWRELERVSNRTLLTVTGGIDVGDAGYLSSAAAALRVCGAEADILSAAEVRDRYPGFDLGGEHALYSPDTGVIAAAPAVAAMLEASGLPIREKTHVERLAIDDDGVVVTVAGGEPIRARRAIVTTGAWTGPLLATAGLALPLQVTREQVFYFAGGETLPVLIDRGAIFRFWIPPMHDAPGAKAAEHGTGERTTADGRSDAIDPEGQARVCDWVASAIPACRPEPVAAETCLYTMTPDEEFVIDARGPLVFASPCSGHGFKFAPLVGETLVALADGRSPPIDVTRFEASRF